jgi:hypothetical protein
MPAPVSRWSICPRTHPASSAVGHASPSAMTRWRDAKTAGGCLCRRRGRRTRPSAARRPCRWLPRFGAVQCTLGTCVGADACRWVGPGTDGITKVQRARFSAYLTLVREPRLDHIARRSSVVDPLRGESSLAAIPLQGTIHVTRVLACASDDHRSAVLLHAFDELRPSAYRRELQIARSRRSLVDADPLCLDQGSAQWRRA